jgi:2-polyprenyl-3-methyl-5-hydroxy-6-metoxy-1,4-benzoquinol methylase
MSRWQRNLPFSADSSAQRVEQWEYQPKNGEARKFSVAVQAGKPLDVLALKGTDLKEIRDYEAFLRRTAAQLYGPGSGARPQAACPICRTGLADAKIELRVFDVPYLRCPECAHVAVGLRPEAAALERVFAESDKHSAAYVDRGALETRMKQIVAPKLDWCLAQFRARFRRAPARVVDVGAGGGHFVAGVTRQGLRAEGFEKSRASRAFANEAFGVELRPDDFLAANDPPCDLMTMWGLLEYLQDPRSFLDAARRAMSAEGLLVVEVPRADALGTRVQAGEGAVIARHMDPTTHVNAFSDESLCTALVEEGFEPVAAWYFGMDAYEAAVQAALRANQPELLATLSPVMAVLQQSVDLGRQCDDIIIAAVPARK